MNQRANGEGSIYRRADGRWAAACYVLRSDGLIRLAVSDTRRLTFTIRRNMLFGVAFCAAESRFQHIRQQELAELLIGSDPPEPATLGLRSPAAKSHDHQPSGATPSGQTVSPSTGITTRASHGLA
jgi:hypothetical protein